AGGRSGMAKLGFRGANGSENQHDPRTTARGHLPAAASEAAGDPQARGWGASVGHPDRARSVHPAVPASGVATAVRSHLLRTQPRLPTGTTRARRGVRGATVHPGRPALGGGRGLGPVFRPGQPRSSYGKVGEADRGPTGAGADPPLSGSRHHGKRGSDGAVRGSAARRSSVTGAGERTVGRSG